MGINIKIILSIISITVLLACKNASNKGNIVAEEQTDNFSQKEQDYINKGREIAKNTFKVLGSNLKKALAKGGVENAITYCNANALGLVDSLSIYYNVFTIKRTSHKTRNEANKPTKEEQTILNHYLNGGEMKPIIKFLENGNAVFYAPIKMKSLCLTCHGAVGETISKKDYNFIKQYYPNDKAFGFKEGDFRGIWSITFNKD